MWLAIDTSSSFASLAWVDPARPFEPPIWQRRAHAGRSHNTILFDLLAEAMRQPPSDALQAVVVGTGPGSYTGTRIGIAAAIGLALRSRGIALYPWPSIAALVPREEGRKLAHGYLWISDARRKRFALAGIQDGRVTSAPQLFERNEALEKCRRSIAEGLDLVSSDDDPQALALALGFEASTVLGVNPDASLLARQVTALPATELQQLRSMQPSPIYLAAPYVTTARTR